MIRDALVVGINTYQYSGLANLQTAAESAEAIAQRLEQDGKFNVWRLPEAINRETHYPFVAKQLIVKLTQLEEALVQLFLPEGNSIPDTALFYFSGHGLRKTRGIQEGFLATSDVNPDESFNGLSLRWLRELLRESPIKQQIVWLDCSYSGELLNFQQEADPGKQGKAKARCFITATREFEVAYDDIGSPYGVLTKVLLEGLDPSRYPQRWVTNYSLVDYLQQHLQGITQRPTFTNFGEPINLTRTWEIPQGLATPESNQAFCPYKGLEYFDCNEEDPKYFYGRQELTDQLLDKVRQSSFLAIIGASGSGKSSVLRAGLLHQLKLGRHLAGSNQWRIKIMVPGSQPLRSLAEVFVEPDLPKLDYAEQLGRAEILLKEGADGLCRLVQSSQATRIVLAIDQFEEVFTLCYDNAEREQFIGCLLGALRQLNKQLCLILAIRADFFSKCIEQNYSGLDQLILENLVAVSPMRREQLQQAIVKPAERVNLEIEPELVEQMLQDVADSPGSLPLLQYTLKELWKQATYEGLKLTSYVQLGGVGGTLDHRATEIFEQFPQPQQEVARHIFLSLTQLGEGIEDTRRRVLKEVLVTAQHPIALVEQVLSKLADARLVVISELALEGTARATVVDIAHEALIRNWRLLRQWLDENRELIRFERKIEEAANEWRSRGKPQDIGFLLQGARLVEVEDYLQNSSGFSSLSGLAMEFIQVSKVIAEPRKLQDYRNRQILLSKVKSYWITGVLERSLENQALLELSLEERPDAIDFPWNLSSILSQQRQVLPLGTKVIELFQNLGAGGTLLILGEKGLGKTTTLLQTARDLIEVAEGDINHPLPVVFNLTSWVEKQRTRRGWINRIRKIKIEDWLLNELIDKYQVSQKIAKNWIDNEKLLLLLDGLDEIQAEERELCIQFLNQFHQEHGSTEIIVCCGIQEYEALATKLRFQQAVCLHPPTQESTPSKNLNEVLARIQIVRGNLLELNVDALVYPTNPMLGFGSVGMQISERVESEVFELLKKRSLKLGEAVVTQAGSLPARYLLHTIVNYRGPTTTEAVVQGVGAALAKTEVLGDVRTIAFPSLGTGDLRLNPFDVAPVVLKAVADYLEENSHLERVIFAFVEEHIYQAYANAYQKLGGVIEQEVFPPCNTYKLTINTPLNQLFVGQRSHLQIELQPTLPGEDTIELTEKTAELYCFISANGLQVFNNLIPLQFNPKTGQPLPVSFELQAYLRGERAYTIQLLIENPDSGKVKIYETHGKIRVIPPEAPEPRLPILPTLNIRVARKPDLLLQVETELPDGETGSHHLTYYLTSRLTTPPIKEQKIGDAILSRHDLTNIRTLLTQTLQQTTNLQPEDTREQMLSLGTYLFNLLFPANTTTAFHEIFWQAINQLSTWLIIEDGITWLPWEFIVPYHPDKTEPLFFLSEKCQLSRWVEGLGTVRYQEIPLGDLALAQYKISEPEQLKQDEDYQAWRKLLNASSSQGIKPVVKPDTPIYGVHLLRYSSELTQKLDIVPREPTSSASLPEAEEVRQERLNLRLKRPLVALSTINENGSSPDYWLLPERVLPFLRAGASAVISSWWATSEAADRIFWSRFYQVFPQRLTLGEAVWRSRLAVKRRLPHSPDWLAYTLFGDPCAKSYEPEPSEGYTALECLNPDEPLHPGKTYYFRASIRSRPPVWYTDRLIQPEELSHQLRALFMAPGLQNTFPEPIPMQLAGYTMRQATLELTPTTPGNYPLLVQLLEGDELVKTLQLNLEVGEEVDA